MGLFNKKKKIEEPVHEERNINIDGLFYSRGTSYTESKALKLSAVYCATNQISNSCALLPIKVVEEGSKSSKTLYDHKLRKLLNGRPDTKHNHFLFFKQMMTSVMLRGNGYALIDRDSKLNVRRLIYLDSQYVQPMLQEDGSVKYLVTGLQSAVNQEDMLDFHMYLDENYRGLSILKYAQRALEGAYEADTTSINFFKSGGNLAGVLKPASPITAQQRKEAAEAWKTSFTNTSDKIPVVIMPYGLDFQPISVTPEDAELLDSRAFSIEEIARYFNIPPYKLYANMDKADAANEIEAIQSLFILDTVMPYVQMMAEEMAQKLFKPSEVGRYVIEFDFDKLMKSNTETLGNYYKTLLVNGIMSINEVRNKLNMEPLEDEAGDTHWLQLSYGNANDIALGLYVKQQEQDAGGNIKNDNKVKQTKQTEETNE